MSVYTEILPNDTPSIRSYNDILAISPPCDIKKGGCVVAYERIWTPLSKLCADTEKGFNKLGYFSSVSPFSAILRALCSQVLIICSFAMAIFSGLKWVVFDDVLFKCDMIDWSKYVLHGVLNVFRAAVEFTPIVGSDLCYGYDVLGLRVEY